VTEGELRLLKSSIDKRVQIETSDGEQVIAKVICVFDEGSDADIFYELVSTSHPGLYARKKCVGGYSLPLRDIVSVSPVE
jgi:hypothetical protein